MFSPGLRNKCHSKFNYVYSKGENKGLCLNKRPMDHITHLNNSSCNYTSSKFEKKKPNQNSVPLKKNVKRNLLFRALKPKILFIVHCSFFLEKIN